MLKSADILDAWRQAEAFWWTEIRQYDGECRRRFISSVVLASEGALDAWMSDPEGGIALIILLDPLPRRVYRGLPLAYATDPKARSICRSMLRTSAWSALPLWQQLWLHQPLANSEKLEDQQQALDFFQATHASLTVENPERQRVDRFLVRSLESVFLIRRFNRFPQRNSILGRKTRIEESVYLAGQTGILEL